MRRRGDCIAGLIIASRYAAKRTVKRRRKTVITGGMALDEKWLRWARQIQSIAQAGATYSKDPYDLERFAQLRALAAEMFSALSHSEQDEMRAILAAETGYLTPKVDVRAVVFRQDKLLFVRETQDGRWSLPGGWADVGDTPGEAAAREVLEETGYTVRPAKLLAVFDKSRHHPAPAMWYTYKLFIRCELIGGNPRGSTETDAVAFYGREELPELSEDRVTPAQVERMFAHLHDPDLPADFD